MHCASKQLPSQFNRSSLPLPCYGGPFSPYPATRHPRRWTPTNLLVIPCRARDLEL